MRVIATAVTAAHRSSACIVDDGESGSVQSDESQWSVHTSTLVQEERSETGRRYMLTGGRRQQGGGSSLHRVRQVRRHVTVLKDGELAAQRRLLMLLLHAERFVKLEQNRQ